ncbi:MAG: hypothetical protein H7338_09920 [Candidatus Sericytochromatia bacterium]|nr:hypothetical protein [Candidatus Sericytochromatia bacterium]
MADTHTHADGTVHEGPDQEEQTIQIDIPENAQLWVGLEQEEGYAPAVIIGGNPEGLRMLAQFATALSESGMAGGQLALEAGDLLLENSEADMLLVLQPAEKEDGEA